MKDVSPEYVAQEEATKRKPVELYHIWQEDGTHRHYTSGDVMVEFQDLIDSSPEEYLPATLKRSLARYDSQLDVTKCTIQAAFVHDPVLEFIAINPIEIYWIRIMKLHRDQFPLEADVVFLGQIKNVTFKGIQADVECVGFEHFLKMPIPKERYQITCNWQLFDSKCDNPPGACSKDDYKTEALDIILDATKTIITDAIFATKSDGYFIGGVVEFPTENEKRTIVAHSSDTITMSYRMIHLEDGDDVNIYPGCDGRAETCRDKFDVTNIQNFLGFPYIPIENPALRT